MKIFVLIVTYNGSRWLNKCLTSLAESSIPVETIVVDNRSTDNSLELVRSFNIKKVFAMDENLGFGKANNLGMKYALDQSADYVLLLNQDAWVRPDTIQLLVEASIKHPEYFILSPIHLGGSERKMDLNFQHYVSPQNCPDLFSDLVVQGDRVRGSDLQEGNNLRELYETTFINAAIWLLPTACITKIGGFDPIFPHYGEDNDYAKRVRFHGFKVGVCPKAFGVHDRVQKDSYAENAYKTKNLKQLQTDILIRLKDIHVPLSQQIRPIYTKAFKSSIVSLLKLNFSALRTQLKLLSFTRKNLPAIRAHRKISSQLGAALVWLPEQPQN
jgi:GT2 family glycosyltransferase